MKDDYNMFSILKNVMRDLLSDVPNLEYQKRIVRAGSVEEKVAKQHKIKVDYLFHMKELDEENELNYKNLNR